MSDTKKIKAKIKYKLRGDLAENWQPTTVLSEREPGLVLDANGKTIGFKIGDGVTPWNELEYHSINTPQNTDLANAYKATAVGTVVKVEDTSPLEHELKVKLKSDSITDFSAVKVSRYGKNLFPIDKDKVFNSIGTFTFDSEGVYGTYGSGASNYVLFSTKYPAGTYSFSAQFSHKKENSNRIIARCFKADGSILTSGLSNYNTTYRAFYIDFPNSSTFFTIPEEVAYWCIGWVAMSDNLDEAVSMKFPQLEFGNSSTSYQPYTEQITTASADGTVSGLTSVAPIMILTSDTEDVIIECEYNKDINKLPFGGSGGIVDPIYNPASENAQSGIALNPIFQKKIEIWKPNTEYKVGDTVISETLLGYGTANVILVCKENHTSGDNENYSEFIEKWYLQPINALHSINALQDENGKVIHETYATKEELTEELTAAIGEIGTALDELHSYAQSLINGGATE